MAKFEEVTDILEDLHDLIVKSKTNYKKSAKSRITKGFLETRIQSLEDYWKSFKDAHQNLIKITTKEERQIIKHFKEESYNKCEEIYLDLKSDMTDALELFTTKRGEGSTQHGDASSHSSKKEGSYNTEVKLPRIVLPTYSGSYQDWQSFEDTFKALIHTNKSLSNVQKFHYLKSCLEGEAKNTIKHIQVTELNYEEAWSTLRNRYSNKRLIVNATLKRLFSFRKINTQSSGQLKFLIDGTKECLTSLKSMNISTVTWDPIVIFLTVQKLDNDTHKEWESHVSQEYQTDLPTLQNFISFLENKIQTLEITFQASSNTQRTHKERTFHASSTQMICKFCNGEHILCHCKEFAKLDPEKRSEVVKTNRLCYNCLSPGHPIYYCKQKTSCKICGKRHHSLLHYCKKEEGSQDTEKISASPGIASTHTNDDDTQENLQDESIVTNFARKQKNALLATALVPVRSESGRETLLRALIDPGSQASFISENATQLIKLKKIPIRGSVIGVGSTTTAVRYAVQLDILSRHDGDFNLQVKAYVLKSITSTLPCTTIQPKSDWTHLDGLTLADPQYFVSSKIDLLLGIDVYTEIVKNNLVKGPQGSPVAQETNLGWILFGNIHKPLSTNTHLVAMHHQVDIDMDHLLKNLWAIDDDTKHRKFTFEEQACEDIYKTEHARTIEGRFIVKLPFKRSPQEVGQTRDIALKRLYQIERKLDKNPKLKEEYTKVMEEYIQLNHMEKVPKEERDNFSVYLPHHAVVRDSETTKVRIVFDASCKGSNNTSLNDLLFVGPQLQEDLRNLIMRWRMKEICFISDIQKMYRMILVKKEDADYQRILWRKHATDEVEDYRMLRVTFGTASAPYLAIKTLKQLSQDERNTFPIGAKILEEDFYVDDCLSGDFTLAGAIQASRELQNLLEKGGFVLQKWASNNKEFLDHIPPSLRSNSVDKGITDESVIKTLGLNWNMTTDSFHYHTKLPSKPTFITKRSILADVQSLYDPLGWISPSIIIAKMLIQSIWKQRLDWDEIVEQKDEEEWLKLRQSFDNMNKIQIKRWIYTSQDTSKINIHGYCDASNKGYCAVVYYRVETQNGDIKTGIIASRTKLAPLKPISLPRLELNGAVLLAKLLKQVREAMKLKESQTFAWTDSTIVLSWLMGDPNRWKTFVSNRVVEILDNISVTQWFHVKSKENPADIGSRGMNLDILIDNKLWWEGPEWLKDKDINFSKPHVPTTELESKKLTFNLQLEENKSNIINEEFNTLPELLKTIVYSLRFINSKKSPNIIDTPITTHELEDATVRCIRIAQREEFNKEIEALQKQRNVARDSRGNMRSVISCF